MRYSLEQISDPAQGYVTKEGTVTSASCLGSSAEETSTPQDGTTFASSDLDEFWRPVDNYEGLHRYDPKFDWEPSDERKIIRKVRLLAETIYKIPGSSILRSITDR